MQKQPLSVEHQRQLAADFIKKIALNALIRMNKADICDFRDEIAQAKT